jgi:hypothetical protein
MFTDQDEDHDPIRRNLQGKSQKNLTGKEIKVEIVTERKRAGISQKVAVEAGIEEMIGTEGKSELNWRCYGLSVRKNLFLFTTLMKIQKIIRQEDF